MLRLRIQSQSRSGQTLQPTGADSEMIQVTCGPMLCRLCVWTEEEWARLPETERPLEYTHAPGLGWVGAVPICSTN